MDIYNDPTATEGGEFTDGDPLANPPVPRTVLRDIWPNMIQRELINAVEGAELTLDANDFTQLLQAITAIAQAEAAASSAQVIPTGVVLDYSGNAVAPSGWLHLNGQTIGPAESGADNEGDALEALYTLLWNEFGDTDVPVTGGRGASAAADWGAGKALGVMDDRGLVRRGYDSTGTVDQYRGFGTFGTYQEDHVGPHTHSADASTSSGGGNTRLSKLSVNNDSPATTDDGGGLETTMKNRAYTPIIKI